MKKAPQAGVMVKQRTPDPKSPDETDESDDSGVEACAQDLIDAVHSKDVKAVAEALKAVFQILDALPHEEGEHLEPHSYEAQNMKAGQE